MYQAYTRRSCYNIRLQERFGIPTGNKPVYLQQCGGKDHITVHCCVTADGDTLPTIISSFFNLKKKDTHWVHIPVGNFQTHSTGYLPMVV